MPRKTNKKKANKVILLVVEGQTEKEYFSELKSCEKLSGITIIPKQASHSSISDILECAIREEKDKVYDSIWCVFDKDVSSYSKTTKKAQNLESKAIKKGIKVADSLPSFEVWFLLHYAIPQYNYLNQVKVIKDLKNYIPNYKKGMEIYSQLKPQLSVARKNAQDLDSKGYETYCRVYKIFEDIDLLKQSP